ncbi:hypothetical protein HPB51_014471 [Rhipicephalus microplus]|uniref:Uncharacterized protein n=1 Tax=Rhipicephalus microplus TaxID=6941 RepID=A0A9J6E9Q9_RHIMP|nr:hypothetical protein HPB51_014471 [Rhipicephalus microplus]
MFPFSTSFRVGDDHYFNVSHPQRETNRSSRLASRTHADEDVVRCLRASQGTALPRRNQRVYGGLAYDLFALAFLEVVPRTFQQEIDSFDEQGYFDGPSSHRARRNGTAACPFCAVSRRGPAAVFAAPCLRRRRLRTLRREKPANFVSTSLATARAA